MWCRSFMKKCQFVTFSVEIADGVGSQKRLLYLLPLLKESQPGTPQRELGLGLVQLHVLAKSLLWDLIMGSPGESQFWHVFDIFFRYNSFWIYGVGKCLLHFAIPKRDCDQFLFMTCPCKHGIRYTSHLKFCPSKDIEVERHWPKGYKDDAPTHCREGSRGGFDEGSFFEGFVFWWVAVGRHITGIYWSYLIYALFGNHVFFSSCLTWFSEICVAIVVKRRLFQHRGGEMGLDQGPLGPP